MKSLRSLILPVVVFILVVVSASTLSWYVRRDGYRSGYSKIRAGDSKQAVVSVYGKPSEITDCSGYKRPSVKEEIQRSCVEVYWYRSFLEQWIFFLDKDGAVIHKAYNFMY